MRADELLLPLKADDEACRLYLATADISIRELFDKTIEFIQLLTEKNVTERSVSDEKC